MLNSCEIWKFSIKMQTSHRKPILQENMTLFSISGVASRAAQNKYKRLKWTIFLASYELVTTAQSNLRQCWLEIIF